MFFYKPNATLTLFARSFRELIAAIPVAPYLRSEQITARVGPERRPDIFPGHPNFSGFRMANERLWPYMRLLEQQSLAKARQGLVRAMFGIRRFVAEKKTLPLTLAALTPTYLPQSPVDPFSGEPLSYNLTRRVVYSVGLDRLDEGGHTSNGPLEDDAEPSISFVGR